MTDTHRGVAEPVFSGMIDARERVTGRIPYTIDLRLPGMLEAAVLRSRVPHARLVRVDTSGAERTAGVVAVLSGADILGWSGVRPHFGPVFRDRPILAYDRVRYVGDPIVAVAAVDGDAALEALERVEVEYDELPAVTTVDEALADGAPILHPGPPQTGQTFADIIVNAVGDSNVCNYFKLRHGDVEVGLASARYVFEDVFESPPVQHVPLETHACVAAWSGDRLTVWATTQIPFMLRSQLAEVFALPASHVRVIVLTLGGGYGGKCYPSVEPIAAALARAAGRPVRLHLSREEEFVTITKHGARIMLTTGLDGDGRIVARKSLCYFNTGAYADIGPRLIKNGGYGTAGPYAIPHVWVDSYAVYTNLPPAGAFRGYGISQAAWAYETQMDMIADRLGIDPLELRLRNLLQTGDTFATGDRMTDAHFRELLLAAANRIGWSADRGRGQRGSRVRGKGLSCIIKGSITPSTSTAIAKLNDDGTLHVLTSSVEMGQGLLSALAIVAAERLALPVDRVRVSTPDTDLTPYDQQTSSSRSSFAMGGAVAAACDRIAAQLKDLAAQELEIAVEDLELADGKVRVKGSPDRCVDYASLIRRARLGNVIAEGVFQTEGGLDPETGQGVAAPHWHQAAAAAEVEVDVETGRVQVLDLHVSVYAGRILNPVQCELQTEGNVAFGLGQALFEAMVFDGGQLVNGNLGDYLIAGVRDMPSQLSLSFLENPVTREVHGIGETALPAIMPAIGNAVANATGARLTSLPLTPERLLKALEGVSSAVVDQKKTRGHLAVEVEV
jgi:CO/xanthine dehydrogenase Mo-binding subunit